MKKRDQGFFANHKLLIAIATLIGTIVGAGILGIPYVISKAGFLYGLLLIAVIGAAFLFLNLFAGEVILRTKKQHQLTGYAEKYLGKTGKNFMLFAMLINIYGALTAYLIGEGKTLQTIFGAGQPWMYTLIFFAIASFIIFRGIKATGRSELILISLLFLVVVIIGIFSFKQINLQNFSAFNPAFFFLPYGVVLFALMGTPAIPELQEVLKKEKHKMKKVIIIGSLIPVLLYLIFATVIVGVIGAANFEILAPNERIATVALSIYSNQILGLFANFLAVLAMFTSFLTLGLALVQVYEYDYKVPHYWALLFTLSLPLVIVSFNITSFVTVLGLTGVIAGGLDGILIILMFWRAKTLGKRKPEYVMGKHRILGSMLILMFAVGIIYQIITNFF